jgi:flavin-binding protein dodecin
MSETLVPAHANGTGIGRASPSSVHAPHHPQARNGHLRYSPVVEFFGASDDTIAEAVRFALASASQSLQTLDGVGVLVIPEICRPGSPRRYRVTLRVTPLSLEPTGHHTT